MPLDPEDQFAVIGKRCAKAALGVDLFVLVPEQDDGRSSIMPSTPIPWYGLPLLRVLSDSSGAPGPLMFGTAYANDPDKETPTMLSLQENVLSRTPWQAGMVFGAQLRFRISPGFELEDTPVEKKRRLKLQLAPFLSSGGLMGPATADESSADADAGLWIMGSCDPYTSLTIDLQAAKNVEDRFNVDGLGEVALRPVIQTCMMYTCIETDGSETDPNFYTVCKMRISCVPMTLSEDVEPIYDALDPEALAAVLYHKIALDAYLEGFLSAQETAESWLKSLMICVYQSAQVEQAKLEEDKGKRYQIQMASGTGTTFVASERLLDQRGSLEDEEVLLGGGHPKISVVPLLVYALMQCDAILRAPGRARTGLRQEAAASPGDRRIPTEHLCSNEAALMTANPGSSSAPTPTSFGPARLWWTRPCVQDFWNGTRPWLSPQASRSASSSPSVTALPSKTLCRSLIPCGSRAFE